MPKQAVEQPRVAQPIILTLHGSDGADWQPVRVRICPDCIALVLAVEFSRHTAWHRKQGHL